VNGVATFNNLITNATGNYTLTASDGNLTGATSGSFMICPLGDVIYAGFINSTNGAADIDAVYAHRGDTTGRYDLNGDGVVNQADVDYLVKTILHTSYADANLDGSVDFLDFQNLLNHWQAAGAGWAGCDFNGDGVTDFMDFQTMLNNWNPAGGGGSNEEAFAPASGAGAVQAVAASQDASQTGAVTMAASAATASGGPLTSNLLTPAAASPAPAPSGQNSPSIHVADVLAPRAASNASVYAPAAKARALSHRPRIAGGSWTSDNDKVDLLTQLIKPVVV
jgi:hypothetical protein